MQPPAHAALLLRQLLAAEAGQAGVVGRQLPLAQHARDEAGGVVLGAVEGRREGRVDVLLLVDQLHAQEEVGVGRRRELRGAGRELGGAGRGARLAPGGRRGRVAGSAGA